jgi:phage terminase small subunit
MRETNHLTHGLFVKSKNGGKFRELTVRRLTQKMRARMPWLEDSDLPVYRAWAKLEVLSTRLYAELRERGLINSKGESRQLLNHDRTMRQTQLGFARELGMTPAARIAMQTNSRNMDVDIEAALGRMEKVKAVTTDADDQYG